MSGVKYLLDTNFILGMLKSTPEVLVMVGSARLTAWQPTQETPRLKRRLNAAAGLPFTGWVLDSRLRGNDGLLGVRRAQRLRFVVKPVAPTSAGPAGPSMTRTP